MVEITRQSGFATTGRAVATACLLCIALPALAASAGKESEGAPNQGGEVQRFCSNIVDAARDRRYALQEEQLKKLRSDIDVRMQELEKKRADYEDWLKRRQDFLVKAKADLVEIYSNMRPDAAAERLAAVRVELAAAILMKIEPRKAGVILNEMNTKSAAMLTSVMADAARRKDPS